MFEGRVQKKSRQHALLPHRCSCPSQYKSRGPCRPSATSRAGGRVGWHTAQYHFAATVESASCSCGTHSSDSTSSTPPPPLLLLLLPLPIFPSPSSSSPSSSSSSKRTPALAGTTKYWRQQSSQTQNEPRVLSIRTTLIRSAKMASEPPTTVTLVCTVDDVETTTTERNAVCKVIQNKVRKK